ncbi:hypothetical protein [Pseudaeromonas pectinilytica]
MRITDQKLVQAAEHQHQQQQIRQQVTVSGQPLTAQEIRVSQRSEQYREMAVSSTQITPLSSNYQPAEVQQATTLNRRDLARLAKEQQASEGARQLEKFRAERAQEQPQLHNFQSTASGSTASLSGLDEGDLSLDSHMRILKALLEAMTGIKIHLGGSRSTDAQSVAPPGGATTPSTATAPTTAPAEAPPAVDQTVQVTELKMEQEQLRFVATGSVTTDDGREIRIDLGFALDYQLTEVSERLTKASALKDPLVLNLEGQVAGFTQARFNFDLSGDGVQERLPMLASGSTFLALDRNGNGQIDNGTELFGVQSGNGFADLAQFDQDGNGVIDEGDSVFAELRLFRPGEALLTLGDKQIGAIFLNATATPFMHLAANQGTDGESPAVLRQTGLYLTEDGKAGTVQQVDLRV